MSRLTGQERIRNDPEQRIADLRRVLDASRHFASLLQLEPLIQEVQQAFADLLDCERVRVILGDDRAAEDDGRGAGPFAVLACPLVDRQERPIGRLKAENKRSGACGAWDEAIARALAAQAGAAIEQVLHPDSFRGEIWPISAHFDDAAARQIQTALLPRRSPVVNGFDIAGWNRPAEMTGGDLYDFHELPGGRVAVTVADVSGHGLGATLVGAEYRALLRSATTMLDGPGEILAWVNRLLYQAQPCDRFVTAFLGLLDGKAHQISYVSAGHGSVWFWPHDRGEPVALEVQGYPLALEEEAPFAAPGLIAFEPGDMLIIVTDGFFEWMDPDGECFGIERLLGEIGGRRDRPAAEIVERLHDEVVQFADGVPQADDLTAVIIKRKA